MGELSPQKGRVGLGYCICVATSSLLLPGGALRPPSGETPSPPPQDGGREDALGARPQKLHCSEVYPQGKRYS